MFQACEGLKANQKGEGESVYFDISSAPDELCCTDWLDIIDGLSFTTSSPGTVRDISYIDVQIGPQTDEKVLKGFCCFMDSLNSELTCIVFKYNKERLSGNI